MSLCAARPATSSFYEHRVNATGEIVLLQQTLSVAPEPVAPRPELGQ